MNAGKETEMYNQGYMDGYNDGENAHIDPDYWTRLEHTYAGMAMQGLMQNEAYCHYEEDKLAYYASLYAHALVEKLKEKEERK